MFCFFFFNVPATTEIYTLSLHDALPISSDLVWEGWGMEMLEAEGTRSSFSFGGKPLAFMPYRGFVEGLKARGLPPKEKERSEEHTSELQSRGHLVCRLLLEKKKQMTAGQ